jgi:hypothetical protein
VAQVDQDVLEELQRNLLRLREPLALHRPVARHGQLEQGADGVIALGRDLHGRHSDDTLAPWT